MHFPDTNLYLISILQDEGNEDCWTNFVDIYQAALIEFAKSKGLSVHDAEDISQNVLASVAKSIASWKPDPKRAQFRTWLCTIANRKIIDAVRKRQFAKGSGGTSVIEMLQLVPEHQADPRLLQIEIRRQLFRRATEAVKSEFSEDAWQAFWLCAVEGIPTREVADTLHKTVGAVYAAKGRVMRRILEYVRALEMEISYDLAEDDAIHE